MKKAYKYIFLALFLVFSGLFSACNSNKTGCPINESTHVKTDRKGNLSTKRGKTSLFPKNMKKKKKKKRGK